MSDIFEMKTDAEHDVGNHIVKTMHEYRWAIGCHRFVIILKDKHTGMVYSHHYDMMDSEFSFSFKGDKSMVYALLLEQLMQRL